MDIQYFLNETRNFLIWIWNEDILYIFDIIKKQPWWPGVKFLLFITLFSWLFIKTLRIYFIFKRKKNKHTKKSPKNHISVYASGKSRLESIPKRYTKKSTKFISSDFFLKNWNKPVASSLNDCIRSQFSVSGCYLILIADKKSTSSTILQNYSDVYAGQSVNIANRVYQHFTGHGNGDVYADIKYGKNVFVKLFPCAKSEMNNLECTLIERFNGLQSYNRTAGGAKKRKKEAASIFVNL